MFHSFLSDDSKQDAATTTAYRKHLIELLKEGKLLASALSTIWVNNDGCAGKYRCASELYFMSVILQCYSVIIDRAISEHGHIKDVVDGLNAI